MGYYTKFRLRVKNADHPEFEQFERNELDANKETASGYYIRDAYYEGFECKWYDHDREMISLSLQYPSLVFELEGDGEEQGDSWRKYYVNGLRQECRAKITYDAFDPAKLKPLETRTRG